VYFTLAAITYSPAVPLVSISKHFRLLEISFQVFLHSMVKPLAFKGDKRPKKRKNPHQGPGDTPSEGSTALTVQNATEETGEDDSWVTAEAATDVVGPVIFALPSIKTSCIACDANGKVFASELDNIVDNDPATAEPHDVRQVWIANRVAGTEEISFKGHHGR